MEDLNSGKSNEREISFTVDCPLSSPVTSLQITSSSPTKIWYLRRSGENSGYSFSASYDIKDANGNDLSIYSKIKYDCYASDPFVSEDCTVYKSSSGGVEWRFANLNSQVDAGSYSVRARVTDLCSSNYDEVTIPIFVVCSGMIGYPCEERRSESIKVDFTAGFTKSPTFTLDENKCNITEYKC